MRTAEHVVVLPTADELGQGVDAFALLPDLRGLAGRRVRVIVEDLDGQEPGECICDARGYCDPECKACENEASCPGGA